MFAYDNDIQIVKNFHTNSWKIPLPLFPFQFTQHFNFYQFSPLFKSTFPLLFSGNLCHLTIEQKEKNRNLCRNYAKIVNVDIHDLSTIEENFPKGWKIEREEKKFVM